MDPASSLPILVMHPFYTFRSSHINWIFDISRSHLQTTTPPQFAPSSCGFSNQSMYNPCTRTQLVQTRRPLPDSVQDEQVGSCTSSSCLGGHEQASSTHDPVRASRPFHHQGCGPATLDVTRTPLSSSDARVGELASRSFVATHYFSSTRPVPRVSWITSSQPQIYTIEACRTTATGRLKENMEVAKKGGHSRTGASALINRRFKHRNGQIVRRWPTRPISHKQNPF